MNKGLLIQYYHRSCRWRQAEPCYVNQHEGEIWHGHNCGTEFFDNYCPRCSHRVEVGRVGWAALKLIGTGISNDLKTVLKEYPQFRFTTHETSTYIYTVCE